MLSQLGEKIQHLRRLHHLTQASLAQQLNLASHAHISNIETGRRPPSLTLIVRIADLFSVSTHYLLCSTIPTDEVVKYTGPREPGTAKQLTLFGDKLRYLRRQHALTQVSLAEQLGLATHSHISLLESGGNDPSLELVLSIADLFQVETDYLLRDTIPVEEPRGSTSP